jgi:hypothetical protein
MKEVYDYIKRSRHWEFDKGIHFFYDKREELSNPEIGIGEYEEIVRVDQRAKSSERTIFTVRLIRTGKAEKNELRLYGDEGKFKQFVNCTLDGVTLEEYRKLPSEVKALLDRKDYTVMAVKE